MNKRLKTGSSCVNAADAPVKAVLFPAQFHEGAAATEPFALAGTYVGENGATLTARGSLSVSIPANGFRILKKA